MSSIWNATTYDAERRRLIYCFDDFYGTVAELITRFCPPNARILDLGAGTGILSSAIAAHIPNVQLHILDVSPSMLEQAIKRLAGYKLTIHQQQLTDPLPNEQFDAIISALAIHHLNDDQKQDLFCRILAILSSGGMFINAEQVAGQSPRLQTLYESVHLDRARLLGSSEAEIASAVTRMAYDQCSSVANQISWLNNAGFEDATCFYQSFRFAVFGGWKPTV